MYSLGEFLKKQISTDINATVMKVTVGREVGENELTTYGQRRWLATAIEPSTWECMPRCVPKGLVPPIGLLQEHPLGKRVAGHRRSTIGYGLASPVKTQEVGQADWPSSLYRSDQHFPTLNRCRVQSPCRPHGQ